MRPSRHIHRRRRRSARIADRVSSQTIFIFATLIMVMIVVVAWFMQAL